MPSKFLCRHYFVYRQINLRYRLHITNSGHLIMDKSEDNIEHWSESIENAILLTIYKKNIISALIPIQVKGR